MPIQLSSGALAQLVNKDIKTDVVFKLYTSSDIYVCDLDVTNYSYSKSRDFNVGVLNITLANISGQYDATGISPINKDNIILALEGYVISGVSEMYPTFKGRVRTLTSTNQAGIRSITLDVYDEAMILQTSDIDKVYEATKVSVTGETLTPVYYDSLIVDSINNGILEVINNNDNVILNTLMVKGGSIYLENKLCTIGDIFVKPNAQPTWTTGLIYYTSKTGTFNVNDVLVNAGRTFSAIVVDSTYTNFIIVKNAIGTYNHSETLYVSGSETTNYLTARNIWRMAYTTNETLTGITTGAHVNNGFTDTFTSAHDNWAEDELTNITLQYKSLTSSGALKMDFDLNAKRGNIKLAEPINAAAYDVYADYTYYSDAYYVEDILTELITHQDEKTVEAIINGDYSQRTGIAPLGKFGWQIYTAGSVVAHTYAFNTPANETKGITLTASTNLAAGTKVGLITASPIQFISGYTYTIAINITKEGHSGGKFYTTASGINFISATTNIGNNWTLINGTWILAETLTYTVRPTITTSSKVSWYVSGLKRYQQWTVNSISIKYCPTKVATSNLTSANLFTNIAVENGVVASHYHLTPNLVYTTIPNTTLLTRPMYIDTSVIYVADTTNLTTSGYIKADEEIIKYTNKTTNTLTGITRAAATTTMTEHEVGIRIYQCKPPYNVWYMPYSNIIPFTSSVTASKFDSINGVNVGSAGSFSITGSTFAGFYYRQGIVVTNTSATDVRLVNNRNYWFNQIQSTGIQTPFVVIDYKKVANRYEAINILRKLLAPNYVVVATIRKNGTNYITYIQGKYITQKLTADYDLYAYSNLVFNSDETTYNRVKVFGKLAAPRNLMWDYTTKVIGGDSFPAVYLQNIPLKYVTNDTQWLYYKPDITNLQLLNTPMVKFNQIRLDTNTINGYRLTLHRATQSNYGFAAPSTAMIGTINAVAAASTITPPTLYGLYTVSNYAVPGWDYHAYLCYITNVYYLKYTGTARFTTASVIATVNRIFYINDFTQAQLAQNANLYEASILLHHEIGASVFNEGDIITDGVATATVHLPSCNSIKVQYNYNDVLNDATLIPSNISFNYMGIGTENDVRPTKLYLDGHPNDDTPHYEQITVEWSAVQVIRKDARQDSTQKHEYYYVRNHGISDPFIYINLWNTEYLENMKQGLSSDNDIYIGTVAFYKDNELWATINSIASDLNLGFDSEGWTYDQRILYKDCFSNQLINTLATFIDSNGKSYVAPRFTPGIFKWYTDWPSKLVTTDKTDIRSAMYNATRMKYFRKTNAGLYWDQGTINSRGGHTPQGQIRISKAQFENAKFNKDKLFITIDGSFAYVNNDNSFIGTRAIPAINRLRVLTDMKAENQCTVTNIVPIVDYHLFTIDLGSSKRIAYIDIQPGYCYTVTQSEVGTPKYDTKFKLDITYSNENVPYEYVTEWHSKSQMVDIDMSTGELKSLTSSDIGEYFEARYLKFTVNADDIAIERTTDSGNDTYCASIAGVAVYESDIIVGQAYTNGDVINLYKDTNVYEELYTQELVDNYADVMLTEFKKAQTKATAAVVWGPHLDVGQTVHVVDSESGTDRNYFIESISNNNGKLAVDMAYYE